MAESQNIEYKLTWRDEYLKWISGFVNAQGGTIFIGKQDDGEVVGLTNAKKLLEDIPNKVRDILGIVIDVNLCAENGRNYIEIKVAPHPYPVSYKGQYHYRSGATKQELKGPALDRFMIQKQGKRWDGIPVPDITVNDLRPEAIDLFKSKAARSGRLNEEALKSTPNVLIENLRLNENNFLKRAAILLFHPDPEKYVPGAYIKIDSFRFKFHTLQVARIVAKFLKTFNGFCFSEKPVNLFHILQKHFGNCFCPTAASNYS
jgi:ATP-dependent DNA helicase RecG